MRLVHLRELVTPAGRRAGSDVHLPVYSVTKHEGFVPSRTYFKKQVFSRDLGTYKRVEKGQFAYATIHLDEGSIGIAPEASLISPMYTAFQVNESTVHPAYLIRFLKSPQALAQYIRFGKGTVHRRKSISLAALGSLEVPLPPLDEQRRIAAILDQADALRAKRRHTLELGADLAESLFIEMVESRIFPESPLRDLVDPSDRINYGVVQPGDEVEGGVPLIRISDLRRGEVDRSALKRISPGVEMKFARSRIRGIEILVTCVGSIGVVAVVKPEDVGSNVARAVTRVPITDPILRIYVAAVLSSVRVQQYFVRELRTVAQPTLNGKQIGDTLIPVPPQPLLEKFAARLAELGEFRRRLESSHQELEELASALSSVAFRGRL